jgi:Dynein heavy chain C-terminal domain
MLRRFSKLLRLRLLLLVPLLVPAIVLYNTATNTSLMCIQVACTNCSVTHCALPHTHTHQVRSPPQEGVYIHGLFIDGAAWSKSEGCLVESMPKVLFTSLPVMLVSANTKKDQDKVVRDIFGAQGPYLWYVHRYMLLSICYMLQFVLLTKYDSLYCSAVSAQFSYAHSNW